MSATRVVPTLEPSLRHNSTPLELSLAEKKKVSPMTVKALMLELLVPG